MSGPIVPVLDAQSAPFWEGIRNHQLVIQRCETCGAFAHPPRPICRRCRSFELGFERVSGRGTLYSFTETHKVFHPFFADRVPYVLGVVAIDEQADVRVLGLVDGTPAFDMSVVVGFEDLSGDVTVPVFRPAAP